MDTNPKLPADVAALANFYPEGNLIPHEWYKKIILDNGKPDINSIIILSEILYWYRPSVIKEESNGRISGYKKKFKNDLLQRSYNNFEEFFGLSTKQIREALIRLEKKQLLLRIFRTILVNGKKISNVMFIKIFPHNIMDLSDKTKLLSFQDNTSFPKSNNPTSLKGNSSFPECMEGPSTEVNTNTKTTTQITTNSSFFSKSLISVDSYSQSNHFEREKEMINIWDRVIRTNEKPSISSKSRLQNLRKVLEETFNNNLQNWEKYCLSIQMNNFLMGGGANNWKADLTWAIKQENLIRVQEGYYQYKEEKLLQENIMPIEKKEEDKSNDPVWCSVREVLKNKKGEAIYNTWLKKLRLKGYDMDKVLLGAPSKFIKCWILDNYKNDIIDSFKQTQSKIRDLEIVVENREEALV